MDFRGIVAPVRDGGNPGVWDEETSRRGRQRLATFPEPESGTAAPLFLALQITALRILAGIRVPSSIPYHEKTSCTFSPPRIACLPAIITGLLLLDTSAGSLRADGYLINDNDPLIVYDASWYPQVPRGMGDYCDDVHYSPPQGGVATYTFVGTGIDYIAPEWNEGAVNVYLDNAF